MLIDFNRFSVSEIDFLLRLAAERADQVLGSKDPAVIASIAQTIATLEHGRAVQQGHQGTREGINLLIDYLEERK